MSLTEPQKHCVICLTNLSKEESQIIYADKFIDCQCVENVYHRKCFDEYVKSNNGNIKCPICRNHYKNNAVINVANASCQRGPESAIIMIADLRPHGLSENDGLLYGRILRSAIRSRNRCLGIGIIIYSIICFLFTLISLLVIYNDLDGQNDQFIFTFAMTIQAIVSILNMTYGKYYIGHGRHDRCMLNHRLYFIAANVTALLFYTIFTIIKLNNLLMQCVFGYSVFTHIMVLMHIRWMIHPN